MSLVGSCRPVPRGWLLVVISLFTFFFLLGHRSLNEPDEGRYAVIASEMIETSNWLVPQLWYVPHLDKPPLTYWAVAASMKLFGRDEWAVRLPVALAGLSGVVAVFFLGCSLADRRAGFWSAIILQTSLLYAIASRTLTPDILVTQFIVWSIYLFWRAWRSFDEPAETHSRAKRSIVWQMGAWVSMSLGFLTKGPVALIIPAAAVVGLAWFGRAERERVRALLFGSTAGLVIFCAIVLPWFIQIFRTVPVAFDFMVRGQMMGHALGTTIRNRQGSVLYYVWIVLLGTVPWTLLLGWVWRRSYWHRLKPRQKEGWILLSSWVLFTLALFTASRSKLPAYVLSVFPAFSVMFALRWFTLAESGVEEEPPAWVWRALMICPMLLAFAVPWFVYIAFHMPFRAWMLAQIVLTTGLMVACVVWRTRLIPASCARVVVGLTLLNFSWTEVLFPRLETALKGNQTLKPLALALKEVYRPGDKVVCWERLPQGLLFYAYPLLCSTNRPLLGGMPLDKVPFEFPGNAERFGPLLLSDEKALQRLLDSDSRVWVIGFAGTRARIQPLYAKPLPLVNKVGQFELFSN